MVVKIVTVLFILCLCLRSYGYSKSLPTLNNQREKDSETGQSEIQISLVHKSFIETTQFDEGDIIDCVDINRQPSLYHPLLKNHEVQKRPCAFPLGMNISSFQTETQSESGFSRTENCPDGTVPIYRTTKDQTEKAKNISYQTFSNIGQRSTNYLSTDPNCHQVFIRLNQSKTVKLNGATGRSSVYNLKVGPDQSSTANIWVESGPPDLVSFVMAGWMVSPPINGDSDPRLFIYWSVDGGVKTGCFNLLCKGFIQVHPRIAPKSRIKPVSKIGGEIFSMKFQIYQDAMTGNWWLVVTNENAMLGYWPKELVPYLSKAASNVAWGGVGLAGNDGNSPPMGSGDYPDGFYDHVAYFRDIHYLNKALKPLVPTEKDIVDEVVDKSGCYGLQNDKLTRSDFWGYRFSFGGPGGGTRCRH